MRFSTFIEELSSRLPELEWKLQNLAFFSPGLLPKGLFRSPSKADRTHYIEEIRADLQKLSTQGNSQSGLYLAKNIEQKINVLVLLCQQNRNKNADQIQNHFSLNAILTRKQWMDALLDKIRVLEAQKTALARALAQKRPATEEWFILEKDLADAEKQLVFARESCYQLTKGY